MYKSAEQIQIFYEISMAIGDSLDLKKMVKKALSVYLKKLNCSAGKVLKLRKMENGKYAFEKVHSIPRNFDDIENYNQVIKSVLIADSQEEYNNLIKSFPTRKKKLAGQNLIILKLVLK